MIISNSKKEVIARVEQITSKHVKFIHGDIRDRASLEKAMNGCDAVIHFAGLKAVGESVADPLRYYRKYVYGSLCSVCFKLCKN